MFKPTIIQKLCSYVVESMECSFVALETFTNTFINFSIQIRNHSIIGIIFALKN